MITIGAKEEAVCWNFTHRINV